MEDKLSEMFSKLHFDLETVVFCLVVAAMTLISYWFWLGKSHLRKRKNLESKLAQV